MGARVFDVSLCARGVWEGREMFRAKSVKNYNAYGVGCCHCYRWGLATTADETRNCPKCARMVG